MYAVMENVTRDINALLYGNSFSKSQGILNYTQNVKNLGKELINSENSNKTYFVQNLINNMPLDLYSIFRESFHRQKQLFAIHDKKYENYKDIADWDSNTDETIRRYCNKQEKKFEQWCQKVSKLSGYQDLINTLHTWLAQNVATNSRDY